MHVPAGAIPKDGPSAGVTMATAILSAARGEPVRDDVAMTGEITLSGLVLPVGGIREKALAAKRLGLSTFILPALNEPDLKELPEEIRKGMRFVPAHTLEQVLAIALPSQPAPASPQPTLPEPYSKAGLKPGPPVPIAPEPHCQPSSSTSPDTGSGTRRVRSRSSTRCSRSGPICASSCAPVRHGGCSRKQ